MLTRECCQRRKEDLLFKEVLNRSYYNFEQERIHTCIASYNFYELKNVSHHYTFIMTGLWNTWFKMYVKRFYILLVRLYKVSSIHLTMYFDPVFRSNMFHVKYIWQCLIILPQTINFIQSYESYFLLKYPEKVLIRMFKSTQAALRHLNYPFAFVQCVTFGSNVISIG